MDHSKNPIWLPLKDNPDVTFPWYESTGVFRYSGNDRLVVEIDRDLARYYRSLIPKWIEVNGTRYPPHITVVRTTKEEPRNRKEWRKYEGHRVDFLYCPIVRNDDIYFWLNVLCKRLEEVRAELGLPVNSRFTAPPDGYRKFFHATIGNLKLPPL